jgi:hypothetical protein
MKKLLFSSILLISGGLLKAQLVNNGGTILVEDGGYIFCAGNFQNNSGNVVNNGKIEVQGNFQNSSKYASGTGEDTLILTGTTAALLNTGTDTINNLQINKSIATAEVKLNGNAIVAKKLDYLQGLFTTDPVLNPGFQLIAPTTAVFNFSAGKEIIGKVTRFGWTSGTAKTFNGSNMTVSTSGGTAPTSVSVIMIPESAGGNPTLAQREVKRKFELSQVGGTGFTADVKMPYAQTEVNTNTESFLVPWSYESGDWTARLTPVTRDSVNNFVSTTGITAAQFGQEWKIADPRYTFNVSAALRGPWNGSTMNTTINANIPLAQPYNVTPFNYTGTESVSNKPVTAVDWVLVECRRPVSKLPADALSATIIGRKAGFLLSNGAIVNPDGVTPISFDITKQDASFIVVRHRNHLPVMSLLLPSNTAGSFANDFTQLANVYKNPAAASNPVVLLSGTGGKYGLWAGDANKNGAVNATDVSAVKLAISQVVTGYQLSDVNLSNAVNATDVSLVKSTISSSAGSSVSAFRSDSNSNNNQPISGEISSSVPE